MPESRVPTLAGQIRASVPVQSLQRQLEYFSIQIHRKEGRGCLIMWEDGAAPGRPLARHGRKRKSPSWNRFQISLCLFLHAMLAFHTETGESCPERWVFAAENSNVWTWQDSVKVASALTLAQPSAKARGWRHTGDLVKGILGVMLLYRLEIGRKRC
jgi:hypothetical protein